MLRTSLAALLLLPVLLPADSPLDGLPPVAGAGARAFLVRHAQAYSNLRPEPEGMSEEQLDHLTDLGREQAARTAEALAGRGVGLVLTSPASRARETARIIADALGVPLRVEPRLRPLEVGDGLDWDARFAEWDAGRDPSPPGGESMAEVGERVGALVGSLPEEVGGGGSAVLVAHSEVIGAYLGQLEGVPPAERLENSVANASISVVDSPREGAPVVRVRGLRPGADPSS